MQISDAFGRRRVFLSMELVHFFRTEENVIKFFSLLFLPLCNRNSLAGLPKNFQNLEEFCDDKSLYTFSSTRVQYKPTV